MKIGDTLRIAAWIAEITQAQPANSVPVTEFHHNRVSANTAYWNSIF